MARAARSRERGITLPELLVSLALGALLFGLAYRSFQLEEWRVVSASAVLERWLDLARSRAVLEQNDYVAEFDVDRARVTVLDDDNSDGRRTPALGEREIVHDLDETGRGVVFGFAAGTTGLDGQPITAAVTFPGSPPRVTFDPLGRATPGVAYLIPREDAERGVPDRMIALAVSGATGRVRRWRYDPNAATPGPWRLLR